MLNKTKSKQHAGALCLLAGGFSLATVSCEADQLRSLVQGIKTIANEIDDQQHVSFGEWLASEFGD